MIKLDLIRFLLCLACVCFSCFQKPPPPIEIKQPEISELDRAHYGEYYARAGDCIACHTAPESRPFSGGRAFDLPFGRIYSTNITPDLETGIGSYTLHDFENALQKGIAKDGHNLYPVMPYTSYVRIMPDDLFSLYVYFMKEISPVRNAVSKPRLNFPLGMRCLMTEWNALYFTKSKFSSNPGKSAGWNRGAYLVQAVGHCGECHTPRGMAYQLKAQSEKDGDHYLAGAVLDNWNATSLAGDSVSGLGAWSKEEIAQFLKSGRTDRVAAAGPMAEVVEKSTQFLNDQDLLALGEYLKSLPPLRVKLKQKSFLQTSEVSHAKFEDTAWRRRLTVYLNNCKICHGQNGEGEKRIYPNLTKNEAVNAPNPISLIHLVLTGSIMHATQTAPTELEMPGLGWRLGDAEVADVLCFVRSHWDNHASQVSPRYVGRIRKKLEKALR